MKLVRIVIALAIGLSILFGCFYLKFFSAFDDNFEAYIVQVGIYKQDENANEMVNKLSQLQLPNYKYQKDNNFVVITGVYLEQQEAKKMGNTVSAKGITCVIKPITFERDMLEPIKQQNYDMIIKAISS